MNKEKIVNDYMLSKFFAIKCIREFKILNKYEILDYYGSGGKHRELLDIYYFYRKLEKKDKRLILYEIYQKYGKGIGKKSRIYGTLYEYGQSQNYMKK